MGQVLIWQVCRCREIEPSSTRDSPPAGCYWHTRIHTHTHKQSSGPQETLHRQVAIDVFSARPTQLLAVWQGWDQPESPERCADTDTVTRTLVFLFFQHAHPLFFSTLLLLTCSTGRVALLLTSDQASLLAGELFYVFFFGGVEEGRNRRLGQCCDLFMLYLHVLIWTQVPMATFLQNNITYCFLHFSRLFQNEMSSEWR